MLAAFGAGALAGGVVAAFPELPKLEGSGAFHRFEGRLYTRDGKTELRRLRAPTSRRYAREQDIPEHLQQAVVAAEDRRFFTHHGVDPRGVLRAAAADLRARRFAEGGSTITQQLVKNAYVGSSRSLGRKSREATLAIALESRWSKRRILTAYLNTAYFGQGAYGVRDAARTYFGVEPRRLNLQQAAVLAALLPAPEQLNPVAAPERAGVRRNHVLAAMHAVGAISKREQVAAAAAPVRTVAASSARRHGARELAPQFSDSVVGQLVSEYGTAHALGGGLRVRTTLDARMQRAANQAVERIAGTGLSSALVALDVRTGEVRAMAQGGVSADHAFNIAAVGHRQPGSAFKPFTLAAAYEHGFTPDTRVLSAPYAARANGRAFRIENASRTYAGMIPLETATWHSDNTVYARVAEQVGIDSTIDAARRAGIRSPIDRVPATVLGALPQGVTPLEIAHAYSTFARHGVRRGGKDGRPRDVLRVSDPRGGTAQPDGASEERVFEAPIADLVTQTLTGVIARGTGTRAAIGRPAAGKTGTTEEYADAWFVGYTPRVVTAVWVGYEQGAVPMRSEYHGGPVSGGTWPAEIWSAFMRDVSSGTPVLEFTQSTLRYVTRLIDPRTRLLADKWCAGAVSERFLEGTEPTGTSSSCPAGLRAAPDVTGMPIETARSLLEAEDFQFEERETVGTEDQLGRVIGQTPPAGSMVARDRELRLLVAARSMGASAHDGE